MKDLLDELDRWRKRGKRVALARVVDVEGSGPREPGAAMAVSEDGDVDRVRVRRLRRRRGRHRGARRAGHR